MLGVDEMIQDGSFTVTNNTINFGGEIEWEFNENGTQATVYNTSGRKKCGRSVKCSLNRLIKKLNSNCALLGI